MTQCLIRQTLTSLLGVKTFILHLPLGVLEEEEEEKANWQSAVGLPVTAAAVVPTFGQSVA